MNSRGKVVVASLVGTAIEFFDFYIYATAAVIFTVVIGLLALVRFVGQGLSLGGELGDAALLATENARSMALSRSLTRRLASRPI